MKNVTSDDELLRFVRDGNFFMFCVSFALNKGYKNVMKFKEEVKFSVGDYDVSFDSKRMCFIFGHKLYFARIITAYFNEVIFVGDSEDEVITDLLIELKKELKLQNV